MAKLTIITDTDASAVWVWELLRKLGYGVEVVFSGNINHPVCHHDALLRQSEGVEQLTKDCENSRKESRLALASQPFNRKVNYPKSSKNSKKRR